MLFLDELRHDYNSFILRFLLLIHFLFQVFLYEK
jgi:hypothetical protein